MKDILEVDSVYLEYGNRIILNNVYFKNETGKITGILGRNGSGKSSLMKIIFGMVRAQQSFIRINETVMRSNWRNPEDMRYLPQMNFIPNNLNIERIFNDFEVDINLLYRYFQHFEKYKQKTIGQLSGGERRIIELLCILKSKSKFCILDEPFTHIMPLHVEKIKEIILEEKQNKGIVLSDHLYRNVLDLADTIYVIAEGCTHLVKNISDIESLGYARIH